MHNIKKSREVADKYYQLATQCELDGLYEEADLGYKAAAAIDVADIELQQGWGGAFNGQVARRDLVQKIIQNWKPLTIIETGTFRGISTQWLAETTSTPIYTSEINKRFFYQARQRLEQFKNVYPVLKDSRTFIKEFVGTEISQNRTFFYLDAHWNEDLPLREELSIIFDNFKHPCVMIDDFRVPFDFGYSYDDYGIGKTLALEILEGLLSTDVQVAFPNTPSVLESGARRGCVVLMRNDSKDDIYSTNLVRFGDARDWRIEESVGLRTESLERLEQINLLNARIAELEYHCSERMNQIEILTEMVRKVRK